MSDTTDTDDDVCSFCRGSGQEVRMVMGRSGMVPCSHCDTTPLYAREDDQ